MSTRAETLFRVVLGFSALTLLFAAKWRTELQHFDFQVWEAAINMLPEGANPYDARQLNDELQAHPDAYGRGFDDTNIYMFLSNPPTWLATIRAFGSSALAVSLAGALCLYGSIVFLTRDRSVLYTGLAVGSTSIFMLESPAATSFLYGQWGFFAAGMVALQIVVRGQPVSGVPTALLAAKPHIAFAAGIVDLVRSPRPALPRLVVPYVALLLVTTLWFGPSVWSSFADAMLTGNTHPPTSLPDMSFGTLSALLPWRSLGLVGVLVGLGASAGFAWRYRDRNVHAVLFASLAISIHFSGHAFMHDWMWLPLVPIVLRWSPAVTVVSIVGVAQAMTMSHRFESSLPSFQPAIGLLLTIGLVLIAVRSESTPADESDDTVETTQDASVDVAI